MEAGLADGMDTAVLARKLALTLIPMILSLSVHECAHAWSAYKLGDSTAKDSGRLTLNPTAHIDPIGTLLIPTLSVLGGGIPFIGWARPTPVRTDLFREGINRRLGDALVSAAGPLSNLLLALLSVGSIALLTWAHVPMEAPVFSDGRWMVVRTPLAMLLRSMFTLNCALALFNLLPIPPLDGHRLLPPAFDPIVRPMARYGTAILVIVFMLLPSVTHVIFIIPLEFLVGQLERLVGIR